MSIDVNMLIDNYIQSIQFGFIRFDSIDLFVYYGCKGASNQL